MIELRSCFSCCSEAETSCKVQCRDTVACKERDQSALQLHWSELMQEPAAAGAISISLGHAAGMKSVVEESWWASTWEMNWAVTYNDGKSPLHWKAAFPNCIQVT